MGKRFINIFLKLLLLFTLLPTEETSIIKLG